MEEFQLGTIHLDPCTPQRDRAAKSGSSGELDKKRFGFTLQCAFMVQRSSRTSLISKRTVILVWLLHMVEILCFTRKTAQIRWFFGSLEEMSCSAPTNFSETLTIDSIWVQKAFRVIEKASEEISNSSLSFPLGSFEPSSI